MRRELRPLWVAALVCLAPGPRAAAQPAPPPESPEAPGAEAPIDWRLSAEQVASRCTEELRMARARVRAVTARPVRESSALEGLLAIETALADLKDALIAPRFLVSVVQDEALRAASARCNDDIAAFQVDVSADPAVHAYAQAALLHTKRPEDSQLARHYIEAGRRAGAHLGAAARAEVVRLSKRLARLRGEYMRALGADRSSISLSQAEAASLPASFVATLEPRKGGGYVVPVSLSTREQFLKNQASGAARRRYLRAFFRVGGEANARRVKEAVVLRERLARKLGFDSWAALQLDSRMAKTPERALALLNEVGTRLLPKARAELEVLAALKAKGGDDTPFAAWDAPYYQELLERTHSSVDGERVRQYFPVDKVVPAVLRLYQQLLGVRFEEVRPSRAWAEDVRRFSIHDVESGRLIGEFLLDLTPRPGRALRPASALLRPGRALPGGGYQRPLAAISGNGPASAPGSPACFSHRDVVDFFHEVGHLMHDTLSTAPHASLYGANVRGDFAEAPSQMLENWMWQPAVLKKVSSHVETGEPLPDELIQKLLERRHADTGIFWTRQVFLAVYDLTLHLRDAKKVDPTRLWFELMPKHTPLPPPPAGSLPDASFLPIMGGYDAGYYGYLWSRVFSQDMFTAFAQGGLENPEVGLRYRREVLEPGGTVEPDALLQRFLGRPVRTQAFYEELGIEP